MLKGITRRFVALWSCIAGSPHFTAHKTPGPYQRTSIMKYRWRKRLRGWTSTVATVLSEIKPGSGYLANKCTVPKCSLLADVWNPKCSFSSGHGSLNLSPQLKENSSEWPQAWLNLPLAPALQLHLAPVCHRFQGKAAKAVALLSPCPLHTNCYSDLKRSLGNVAYTDILKSSCGGAASSALDQPDKLLCFLVCQEHLWHQLRSWRSPATPFQ